MLPKYERTGAQLLLHFRPFFLQWACCFSNEGRQNVKTTRNPWKTLLSASFVSSMHWWSMFPGLLKAMCPKFKSEVWESWMTEKTRKFQCCRWRWSWWWVYVWLVKCETGTPRLLPVLVLTCTPWASNKKPVWYYCMQSIANGELLNHHRQCFSIAPPCGLLVFFPRFSAFFPPKPKSSKSARGQLTSAQYLSICAISTSACVPLAHSDQSYFWTVEVWVGSWLTVLKALHCHGVWVALHLQWPTWTVHVHIQSSDACLDGTYAGAFVLPLSHLLDWNVSSSQRSVATHPSAWRCESRSPQWEVRSPGSASRSEAGGIVHDNWNLQGLQVWAFALPSRPALGIF